MNKAKILSLILAVLMLCTSLLVGCAGGEQGGEQGGPGVGNITNDATDPAEVYDAEIKNLNGHEFRFYVGSANSEHLKVREIYAEAPTGDKINDAVFQRNAQLQQTYNCTIIEERVDVLDIAEMLRDPLMAGEYICDYIYINPRNGINLASANLLVDFNELDNIDLTKAWWDQNALNGVNVGGKTFFLLGNASDSEEISSWVVCFNKEYVKEYQSDIDLYQEVRDGKWTTDRMYDITVNTWEDINGDGAMVVGTDRFGYVGEYINNAVHIICGGITIGTYSTNGDILIPDQPKPEVLDAWAHLRPLLTTGYRDVSDAPVRVRTGLGTFAACNMGATVLKAGQSQVPLGLLPMPKLYETQDKYYTTIFFGITDTYTIPITVENAPDWASNGFSSGAEQAAYFLEAFGYYSRMILEPAFYENVVLKQNATDDSSAEMVELALANKLYDPLLGYEWGRIAQAFYYCGCAERYQPGSDINYDNLVSTYTSRVAGARKAADSYVKAINTTAVGG